MKNQILEKLTTFVNLHGTFSEECEVVYLMVELRKLLDRDRENGHLDRYSIVRFHADWVLHTKKERITPAMKIVLNNIDNSIDVYPKNGNIDFLLLPEFRKELTELLKINQIPNEFCKDNDKWTNFMVTLAGVLADQPIVNPTVNISEFRYIDMNKEGIMANIEFRGGRAGQSVTLGFGL